MKVDATLAGLLSELFLDMAKVGFIATFATPALVRATSPLDVVLIFTRGSASVIMGLYGAWFMTHYKEKLQ